MNDATPAPFGDALPKTRYWKFEVSACWFHCGLVRPLTALFTGCRRANRRQIRPEHLDQLFDQHLVADQRRVPRKVPRDGREGAHADEVQAHSLAKY